LDPEEDDDDDDDDEEETVSPAAFKDLKRQQRIQARQAGAMMELIAQLTAQLTARDGHAPAPRKPRIATPEKYEGGRTELRAFLTNVDLYCELNDVPNDQEKILTASMHMKGKAANWMQPYVEDYLKSRGTNGEKQDTQELFKSWKSFQEEMGRIFGEVDAENQAEKAITRLKQTKSVSAYTAEFKQLQARIDWDDAALRTVFENGLKEAIKDSLVHHEKPEDLQGIIELATRIDNRLWERNQQKAKPTFQIANTKKHRYQAKFDRDGDTIMVGKVQTERRKTTQRRPDGLSKEERQKRYDSKACLRCGEVGHFRRDCPKNEDTGKIRAVKIGMIRQATPYIHAVQPSDSEVSDTDLYEEARLLDNDIYELIPKAQEAPTIVKRDDTTVSNWSVTSDDVIQRLHDKQCWVCGNPEHMADECEQRGRIAITGPRAEEVAYQAIHEQPYFEELHAQADEPVLTRKPIPVWQTAEHQQVHWTACTLHCRFHKGKRRTAGWRIKDEWHEMLEDKECRIEACSIHQHEKDTTQVEPKGLLHPQHQCLHWTFCHEDSCMIHYDAKSKVGYFPQKRSTGRGQRKN
jgi:hypothetical protein